MSTLAIKRFFLSALLLLIHATAGAAYWSEGELNILRSLQLKQLPEQYNNQSNRFAYHQSAITFGKQLFFDKRFSLTGTLSCASCHQPDKGFTDGLAKAKGIHKTGRNTITLLGAAYHDWFYWDGRKDSLWSQALVPFEAADEMASSRVQVLRIIGKDQQYREQYQALFGQFPDTLYQKTIQTNAGPWGDSKTRSNWYRIPKPIQKHINHAYANIGKAIAAYERSIKLPETRFDHYLNLLLTKGEKVANTSIDKTALAGMKLFIDQNKTHCMRCHNGPMLTNGGFHNINTGNFKGQQLDFGRFLGIQVVTQDMFNCLGQFSDAKPEDCNSLRFLPKQVHGHTQGAFKTPTLRYLNKTTPYFHDGRFSTINDVLSHYKKLSTSNSELPPLELSDKETQQLSAFIKLLHAP